MIPNDKQDAVQKALQTAFGVTSFESIRQLTKGLSSALVSEIVVRGDSYLLRVITSADATADPTHYFECMKISAQAGIAPPIIYTNNEDRISITGFIKEKPFPLLIARHMIPDLLRRMHALPKFPYRINYLDSMENIVSKFRAVNIIPMEQTKDLFESYSQIRKSYPINDRADWVSSHTDLKPENILFDGARVWLVDWEAAFLNDRYTDLAIVSNFLIKNDADELFFLERYFEEPVTEYQQARFFLMRQMLHVFYFTMFTMLGAAGKPINVPGMNIPEFNEFHDRIWNGDISMAANDARLIYGLVHMKRYLENRTTVRVADSVKIILQVHKNQ